VHARDHGLGLLVSLGSLLALSGCLARADPSASPSAAVPKVFVERDAEPNTAALEPRARCRAELAAQPTRLFDGSVAVQLPAGLDAHALERGRALVRWRPLAAGCRAELTAELALLTFSSRGSHPTPMAEWHHRVFELLRLPDEREIDIVAGELDGDDVSMTIAFEDDPVWDDTRIYLRITAREGRVVALAYMAQTRDWSALAPSLAASARSLALARAASHS